MATGQEILQLKLMSYKNRGKTYVRAYRNKWIPALPEEAAKGKKGRSVPEIQIQVGVIQPSGRVKMSSGFLSKYPELSLQDWYYLDHDLVDENTYFSSLPEESKVQNIEECSLETPAGEDEPNTDQCSPNDDDQDEEKESNHRFFLSAYALKGLAMHRDLVSALADVFGKKEAEQWISLAIYQILDGSSADCYSDWSCHQILPRVAQNLSGRDITKILRTCNQENWDAFWAKRFKTLQEKQSEISGRIPIRYCAIDSTSINSYSSAEQVEFGHAKQDERLPQLNLAMVLDQLTGHIVYAFAYNGSINDRSSYSYIFERMKRAGFPMDQIMLISDRGYPSNAMLKTLIDDGVAFLTGCPIAVNSNDEKWILGPGRDLERRTQAWDRIHNVYAQTGYDNWRRKDGTTVKVYSHLFYDPERAQAIRSNLNSLVVQVFDELKRGVKVDRRLFQEARPYLKEISDPKGSQHQKPQKIWVIDQDAVNRTADRAGWLNIKSNVVEDASVAIDLYRMRGLIEQGFDQMKNQLPGRRLRVTEASHLGKLLVYLIGCDLRLQIRHNLLIQQERGPNWKMELPGNSIKKLLKSMDRYTVHRKRSNEAWLLDMIPKRVRDWLNYLFLVDLPPRKFRS